MELDFSVVLSIIGVLAATGLAYFISAGYRHRSYINQLRKQGFPMPAGWSWLMGHILILLRHSSHFPPLANLSLVMQEMLLSFPTTEMFLLDLWPTYPPVIVNGNPEGGFLVSQKYNLPKPRAQAESIRPIVGGLSLLSMNGGEWKTWRSRFNPGFSTAALMEQVPYIVDRVQVFSHKLRANAGREIISLDEFATRLTFEVIMKVSLDASIDYQHSEHLLPTSINTLTRWHSFWDPRILLNPLRPFVQWYHGNVVKRYIRKELEQSFSKLKAEHVSNPPLSLPVKRAKANSAIALALEAYIADSEEKNNILSMARLNDDFVATVTYHIRLFLLAGNDTTASTITFMFHLLSKHPQSRSKLRAEHDAIFGPDISHAGPQLKQHPALLNQCRYTLAVIKETLRLYPPSMTMRQGNPGFSITTLDGVAIPTEGLLILTNTEATHQNPRVWVRPGEFLPERWLAKPDDELYPPQGAYRPFDVGPRSCLGQTLTLIELRTVLILTARSFEIKPAYEEWDKFQAEKERLWTKMARWVRGNQINTIHGDRAYQMDKAGAHPSEGYPCKVSLVE